MAAAKRRPGVVWLVPPTRYLTAVRRHGTTVLAAGIVLVVAETTWIPTMDHLLRVHRLTAGGSDLVGALLLAVVIALVMAVGTGWLWTATLAGVGSGILTLVVRMGGEVAMAGARQPQLVAALLGGLLLVAFVASATGVCARASLVAAWTGIRGRPLSRARGVASVAQLLGLAALLAGLVLAPDLERQLRHGLRSLTSESPAGALIADPAPGNPPMPASGTIVRDRFYSAAMHQERVADIYLPPSYSLPQAQRRAYPVLYLLHGDDASVDAWSSLGIHQALDSAIANDRLPEIIVVMPDGAGRNDETDWANRWDGSDRIEDQVVELVADVDDVYRTLPDRSFRFIGGYSAGGFGALNIGLHHTDLFSVAMSFSGFAAADDGAADAGVFAGQANIEYNSPRVQVTTTAGQGLYYVLSAGEHDLYFLQRTQAFADELTALGIAHDFHVVPGGHDGAAWMAGLAYGLDDLRQRLRRGDLLTGHQ